MYLHIGKDVIIKNDTIIGIFDLEYIKNTQEYKKMYDELNEKGNIINIADDSKKTFILVEESGVRKAYITNISSSTIGKRKNIIMMLSKFKY